MKYLFRIAIVLFLFWLLASLLFLFVEKGQISYRSGNIKFKEMFEDTTSYQATIFGSSRAYKNIDPLICDSITGLSFYNAGLSGAKFYEVSMAFFAYFEVHNTDPEYVIFNLDAIDFSTKDEIFNPLIYFSFLNNENIAEGLDKKEYPIELYKYLPFMQILEYNDDVRNNSMKGLLGQVNAEDIAVKGHSKKIHDTYREMPLKKAFKLEEDSFLENETLENIIKYCKDNHVMLIFTISPVYKNYYSRKFTNNDRLMEEFERFALEKDCEFWRFDTASLFKNSKEYFTDDIHLNRKGTVLFSRILGNKIIEYRQSQ